MQKFQIDHFGHWRHQSDLNELFLAEGNLSYKSAYNHNPTVLDKSFEYNKKNKTDTYRNLITTTAGHVIIHAGVLGKKNTRLMLSIMPKGQSSSFSFILVICVYMCMCWAVVTKAAQL